MSDSKIIMLIRLPDKAITGGEIYISKLNSSLHKDFPSVENISWEPKPHSSMLQFLVSSIMQNLSFLKILKDINSKTVIIEDISACESQFLFNLLTRCGRRFLGKDVILMPVVTHTYAPLINNKIKRQIRSIQERIFINSSDAIIVISEFTRATVEAITFGRKDIVIAYPGLNIPSKSEDSLNNPGRNVAGSHIYGASKNDPSEFHMLFVGYVVPRKGVDTLIKSIEILIKNYNYNNIILHIAGDLDRDPAYSKRIKGYCLSAGLENNVRIHGRVSDDQLKDLYNLSDVFVFPSLWEGFGMVLIEAMYYKLPIVATDVGAIPYLIKDGQNGILIPPNDPERLASSIKKLIESPDLRRTFAEHNYMVAKKFNWDTTFSGVESYLKEKLFL